MEAAQPHSQQQPSGETKRARSKTTREIGNGIYAVGDASRPRGHERSHYRGRWSEPSSVGEVVRSSGVRPRARDVRRAQLLTFKRVHQCAGKSSTDLIIQASCVGDVATVGNVPSGLEEDETVPRRERQAHGPFTAVHRAWRGRGRAASQVAPMGRDWTPLHRGGACVDRTRRESTRCLRSRSIRLATTN